MLSVIMDVPVDACADTGGFSLIYKQNILDFQPYFDSYLFVAGKSMTLYKGRELKPEKKRGQTFAVPGVSSNVQGSPLPYPTLEKAEHRPY